MSIINFKTVHFQLSASGNLVHSIRHYKVMRPDSNLRLPKKREAKNCKFKKEDERETCQRQ